MRGAFVAIMGCPIHHSNTRRIELPTENLIYLFDPSVGVYSDASLSKSVSDGAVVRGWKDSGPNQFHVAQTGNEDKSPIYRASVPEFGGRPALEFNNDQYLSGYIGDSLSNYNQYTMVVVFRAATMDTDYLLTEGRSDSDATYIAPVLNGPGGNVEFYHVGAEGQTHLSGYANNHNDNTIKFFIVTQKSDWWDLWVNYHRERIYTKVATNGDTYANQIGIGGLIRSSFSSGFTGQIALVAAYGGIDNYDTIAPIIHKWFGADNYYAGVDKTIYAIGDSKTFGVGDRNRDQFGGYGYVYRLTDALTATTGQKWRELRHRAGHSGFKTVQIAGVIDDDLSAVVDGPDPEYTLIDTGANDFPLMPDEMTFKSALNYIVDAIEIKWPSTKQRIMLPWRRGYDSEANIMATWIYDVVATRDGDVALGPDQRIFLENGDDGATYTDDGTHPNPAGYALTAAQWQANMGY